MYGNKRRMKLNKKRMKLNHPNTVETRYSKLATIWHDRHQKVWPCLNLFIAVQLYHWTDQKMPSTSHNEFRFRSFPEYMGPQVSSLFELTISLSSPQKPGIVDWTKPTIPEGADSCNHTTTPLVYEVSMSCNLFRFIFKTSKYWVRDRIRVVSPQQYMVSSRLNSPGHLDKPHDEHAKRKGQLGCSNGCNERVSLVDGNDFYFSIC